MEQRYNRAVAEVGVQKVQRCRGGAAEGAEDQGSAEVFQMWCRGGTETEIGAGAEEVVQWCSGAGEWLQRFRVLQRWWWCRGVAEVEQR